MTPEAERLLHILRTATPHREVYRSRTGECWRVNHRGGRFSANAVRELFDGGYIQSVWSNCPYDAYHIGRTVNVDRSKAERKKRGKSAPTIFVGDP
jgi:hypothetical protein